MKPRVAILLTTYNGAPYLGAQMNSILAQEGCDVTVFASDDHSTDGTLDSLHAYVGRHPGRVNLRTPPRKCGSAGKNFFSLIRATDTSGFTAVAFSDQDDICLPDHLQTSLEEIRRSGAVGTSCNVTAFWKDGRQRVYRKNQPQRRLDYLFESPGTGCTFVMAAPFFKTIQRIVSEQPELVDSIYHHDWLVYAVARALGHRWSIRERPTLMYRQHDSNETGARFGRKGIESRWLKIRSGWYRRQVMAVSTLLSANGIHPELELCRKIDSSTFGDRLKLMGRAGQFRRAWCDQLFLAFLFGSGIFWNSATRGLSSKQS